jgi:hypothetical protein
MTPRLQLKTLEYFITRREARPHRGGRGRKSAVLGRGLLVPLRHSRTSPTARETYAGLSLAEVEAVTGYSKPRLDWRGACEAGRKSASEKLVGSSYRESGAHTALTPGSRRQRFLRSGLDVSQNAVCGQLRVTDEPDRTVEGTSAGSPLHVLVVLFDSAVSD